MRSSESSAVLRMLTRLRAGVSASGTNFGMFNSAVATACAAVHVGSSEPVVVVVGVIVAVVELSARCVCWPGIAATALRSHIIMAGLLHASHSMLSIASGVPAARWPSRPKLRANVRLKSTSDSGPSARKVKSLIGWYVCVESEVEKAAAILRLFPAARALNGSLEGTACAWQ